jgi:hypothetical protein
MKNESFHDSFDQKEAADAFLVQQGMAIDDAGLNEAHEGTIDDCRPRPRDATLIDFAAIKMPQWLRFLICCPTGCRADAERAKSLSP